VLDTRISGKYRLVAGQQQRYGKPLALPGLNHNHELKIIFIVAATAASVQPEPLRAFYEGKLT